ncbi:MAG: hypothetical protein KF883_03350 [Thermomicrobiales bacterium]|nr:hypothetical protein [Thermomicrobiales bacterium]
MHVGLSRWSVVAFVLAFLLASAGPGINAPLRTSAQVSSLDLAAMALEQSDLPDGYRQHQFDNEGYTPGHRMAAIQFGDQIPVAELEPLGIVQFYSSTFFTDDETGSIYVYLTEFENEAAVQAGFDYFEDEGSSESATPESEDLAGPAAGEAPKEITISGDSQGASSWQFVDATFRVDRILAGVMLLSDAETPSVDLAEELAAALADRIETVLRGDAPGGVEPAVRAQSLKLFDTWPWPGNSLEGYKNAGEFLGAGEGLSQFSPDFLSGYTRFASAGSIERLIQHEPPYIDLAIALFASEEAAHGALEASAELPLHYSNPVFRTPEEDPAIEGVDAAVAFTLHRDPIEGVSDSFELIGYNVVFVSGSQLVSISILSDILNTKVSVDDLREIVLDLAAQQASCLMQDGECGGPEVPLALADVGAPATPVP